MTDFHSAWKRARIACNSRRKIYPPRVDTYDNGERYWRDPPPVLSPRCLHVVKRMREGWAPRLNNGYYSNSTYLGVYIWEYINIVCYLDTKWETWTFDDAGRPVPL
jgi:hypothetical protein